MPASAQDERRWLDPKWLVVAAALAVFGLIVSYDVRLGMAAGALLGAGVFVWLYLALRYASPKGAASGRSLLVERVRQQTSNRRAATDRIGAPASLEHFPTNLGHLDGADFGSAQEERREPC